MADKIQPLIPVNNQGLEGLAKALLEGTPEDAGERVVAASNIGDAQNYITLEAKTHGTYSYPDLLISKGKSYLGKDWNDCSAELKKENAYMLTIRQFADFLALLKSGKAFDGKGKRIDSKDLKGILDEISKVGGSWRSEWLDAKFAVNGNSKKISYSKIMSDGSLKKVTEDLGDCLMSDETPGIDFDSWIKSADYHGLPKSGIAKGQLYYWFPRNNAVARFYADSGRANLSCYRDPTNSDAALGVRVARKKV